MPKTMRAPKPGRCFYCRRGIRKGSMLALDFDLRMWVHFACWQRHNEVPADEANAR